MTAEPVIPQIIPDRRSGDLMILEKLGHIEKELAVNTTETKNIVGRLDKLNGSVARHEEAIHTGQATEIKIAEQVAALLADKTERDESAKVMRRYWVERILWIVGVLVFAVLTKLDIINL